MVEAGHVLAQRLELGAVAEVALDFEAGHERSIGEHPQRDRAHRADVRHDARPLATIDRDAALEQAERAGPSHVQRAMPCSPRRRGTSGSVDRRRRRSRRSVATSSGSRAAARDRRRARRPARSAAARRQRAMIASFAAPDSPMNSCSGSWASIAEPALRQAEHEVDAEQAIAPRRDTRSRSSTAAARSRRRPETTAGLRETRSARGGSDAWCQRVGIIEAPAPARRSAARPARW